MRIAIAVDGSPASTRAVRHVASLCKRFTEMPEVVVVHVDAPLLRSVAIELGTHGVDRYHAENGKFALKAAKAALVRAKVRFEERLLVGDPATTVVRFLKASRCDQLAMGSHGRGAFKNLVLGSVATKILSQCDVPVTIVR